MYQSNNGGKFGGKPSYGSKPSFGGGSRGSFGAPRGGQGGGSRPSFNRDSGAGRNSSDRSQIMHKANCSECGNNCEVPFRPTNGKPVLCQNCFAASRNSTDSTSFRNRDEGDFKPKHASRYESAPRDAGDRGNKPEQSERVIVKSPFDDKKSYNDMKNDIEKMNAKMDKMYSLLERMMQSKNASAQNTKPAKPAEAVTAAKAVEAKSEKVETTKKATVANVAVVKEATKTTKKPAVAKKTVEVKASAKKVVKKVSKK